jgi:hypothetical protein
MVASADVLVGESDCPSSDMPRFQSVSAETSIEGQLAAELDDHERLRHRDCGSATRGVGMRQFAVQSMSVVIGIGLLGTTQALADPVAVTSGQVTARLTGGTFTLTGDGFSLTGAASYESGLWECTPCRASDRLNLSLSSRAGGSFDSGLEGEFDHVHYDATWLAGHLAFTAPDMTSAILAAGRTSISMPFTFSGELANYESFKSRANGSPPLFIATFTGSGVATAHFQGPVADPNGALFFADRISYDFAPGAPSPTPEPASLLLLGTGAAGLLARRRVRRNLGGLIQESVSVAAPFPPIRRQHRICLNRISRRRALRDRAVHGKSRQYSRYNGAQVVDAIASRNPDDDRNIEYGNVLLIGKIAIRREERVELGSRQGEQLAIALAHPSHLRNGSRIVADELAFQASGQTLVKQDAHGRVVPL